MQQLVSKRQILDFGFFEDSRSLAPLVFVPVWLIRTFLDPAGLHPYQILYILDLALHLFDRMREFKLRITVVVQPSNLVRVL